MRPRRRRGTGTIEPMPDGTFRPRMPGAGGRLDPCPTYEEAERILDAAIATVATDAMCSPDGKTLRGFGIGFLDDREHTGVASVRTDRSRWRQHIETAYFADWSLSEVAPHDVREWLAGLMRKHAVPGKGQKHTSRRKLSRSTIQNTLNLLRSSFAAAVDAGLIRENPARDVSLPRDPGRTHDPWTYIEPAEQDALLGCEAIPEEGRLLIAFAIGTGLRQGEMWNLELRDVHVDESKIVVRYGSKGRATKGRRIRRVPLFGIARQALDRWLEVLPQRENPLKLVWPLPSGARRQKGKAPKEWESYLEKAGIVAEKRHDGRPVRWHDLRHTCGSSLVAGWWGRRWSLIEVRDMLGHRSVTTTERYAHLAESALEAAARATDDLSTIYPRPEEPPSNSAAIELAPPRRLERPTNGLGNRCSIH